MLRQGKAGYPVDELIIHTAATAPGWMEGHSVDDMVAEIRRWHVEQRGWRNIGYHRVIAPDGSVGIGRKLAEIPAQVAGHNRGKIGVCLVPVNRVEGVKRFEDFYTQEQRVALRDYILELEELTGPLRISGHNDYAAKDCPGFRVRTEDWR